MFNMQDSSFIAQNSPPPLWVNGCSGPTCLPCGNGISGTIVTLSVTLSVSGGVLFFDPGIFFSSSPDVHEMLTWLFWRAITNTVYINEKRNKVLKCQLPSCTTHVSGVWQSLQGITSLKPEIVSVFMVSRSWWFWQYMYDAGFYVRFAWIALYRWNVSVWIWDT